ncbi:uncharacterized protein F4812DRAFT_256557 [Daldinia caldariorum]|uniref:uncharacterized protein n=1 Tax=Daldinia caldariorum TaxID=326644 RepID=UPI0020085B25|nr:uncharacterized protein F4812DRAFT_256557 [Daldinia caldariorum]KAI1463268.1 hypothetical protein F4812DRAFT_256557 [Daldinia caldariorum]
MAATKPQSEYWKPAARATSLLARPVASASDYKLRMYSGWTVTDGTFQPVTEDRRSNRNVPYPSYIDQAYRATYGLSSLQLAGDAPISLCAMDVATDHLWKCAPDFVKGEVNVYPPNGPALWSQNESHQEAIFRQTEQQTKQRGEDVYSEFKSKPWGLWPLWVEDEWGFDYVLLVWYADASTDYPDYFDNALIATIYDPRREAQADGQGAHFLISGRAARLERQVKNFFDRAGFKTDRLVFVDGRSAPMPLGEATSGERCFAATKEVLSCILNYYLDAATGIEMDLSNGRLWSLSQWVNPYEYRIEMAGINAWVLMATFDYNARITVECIEPEFKTDVVADGRRLTLQPFHLAGPHAAPEVAADDYLLHSGQSKADKI